MGSLESVEQGFRVGGVGSVREPPQVDLEERPRPRVPAVRGEPAGRIESVRSPPGVTAGDLEVAGERRCGILRFELEQSLELDLLQIN